MATSLERAIIRDQTTGAAALSATITDATRDIQIISVDFHLDAAGGTSENFTLTRSDANNSEFNTLLVSQDMNTETDLVLINQDADFRVMAGDSLVFAFDNTDTNTFGLTVMYHALPSKGGTK